MVKLTRCFKSMDCFQLLDNRGKCIGDDSDHDKDGEEQYEKGGHDELDILDGDAPVLLDVDLAGDAAGRQHRAPVRLSLSSLKDLL